MSVAGDARRADDRARRASRLLVASVVALFLAVAGLYVAAEQAGDRLAGVELAGPCRALGVDAPECKRQARLIVKSCLTHSPCRKLVLRLSTGPNALSGRDSAPDRSEPPTRGGDASSAPPPASSQPGPPRGGSNGGAGGGGGSRPPKEPGLLGPVIDPTCELTQSLNLC